MTGFAIRRDTADTLKGIAILLMMAHHLFGLPGLIAPENAYWPLIPGVPVEYWIGRFGKICVGMFLVLSGYGLAVSARGDGWRRFGWRGWRFLLAFWPYFLLAFTLGHLFFQERLPNGNWRFPVDPVEIALNALTLRNSMAFEWWFAEVYLLLLLVCPLLLRLARWPGLLMGLATMSFLAGSALDVWKINTPLVSLANLMIWQWPFAAGVAMAGQTPAWLAAAFANRQLAGLAVLSLIAGFAVVERAAPFAMTPFLIIAAPVFVAVLVTLWAQERSRSSDRSVLRWLGQHTLGLWLVHPFLCYYFFQAAVFAPRWSPLVMLLLVASSAAIVWLVERLRAVVFSAR